MMNVGNPMERGVSSEALLLAALKEGRKAWVYCAAYATISLKGTKGSILLYRGVDSQISNEEYVEKDKKKADQSIVQFYDNTGSKLISFPIDYKHDTTPSFIASLFEPGQYISKENVDLILENTTRELSDGPEKSIKRWNADRWCNLS